MTSAEELFSRPLTDAEASAVGDLLLCGVHAREILIGTSVGAQIGSIRISRDWAYFRIEIDGGLPLAIADQIQNTPYIGATKSNSGEGRILGSVVRVDGYCGGAEPAERAVKVLGGKTVYLTVDDEGEEYSENTLRLLRQDPSCVLLSPEEYEANKGRIEKRVMSYHIDTLLGLKMFIDIIRSVE